MIIKNRKSKKAVSELIAYVLLIGMSLMMAGGVYVWMKTIANQPMAEEVCPEDISLIIHSYSCGDGVMNLTVKNKGFFNVSGYIVKINNVDRKLDDFAGKYPLCTLGAIENYKNRPPGNLAFTSCNGIVGKVTNPTTIKFNPPLIPSALNTSQFNYSEYKQIMQMEIEPMRGEDLCKNRVITQAIQGCQ